MALCISSPKTSGAPILQLVGRVSDVDARELSNELRTYCRQGHETIVVDISGVQFMDSHGLGVFVYYSTVMDKSGRKIVFVNTNRNATSYMNRLFEITNLDKILNVADAVPTDTARPSGANRDGGAIRKPMTGKTLP